MASAPRIVTRKAAGPLGAAGAAASAPARPTGDGRTRHGPDQRSGRRNRRHRQSKAARRPAPTAAAACTGRARLCSRMPSSSRACASTSMRQLAGDLRRQVRRQPALHIDLGQFGQFLAGIALERALLKPQVGRLGIGLRTHGRIHRQPSTGHPPPGRPAPRSGWRHARPAPPPPRDQAGGGHDAVVRAQYGRAQPLLRKIR